MKIRIQDNSVRFRITVRELEKLAQEGSLLSTTTFPNAGGKLTYGIRSNPAAEASTVRFMDGQIVAELTPADLARLQDDAREGVYFQFESHGADDTRFMFFLEKDRPGSACEKPEHWIYEEVAGRPASFTSIPPKPIP